jgi:hypothetical protein
MKFLRPLILSLAFVFSGSVVYGQGIGGAPINNPTTSTVPSPGVAAQLPLSTVAGNTYSAQNLGVFPGATDYSSTLTANMASVFGSVGGTVMFGCGTAQSCTYNLHGVYPPAGAIVRFTCASRAVTLFLPNGSNTFMFASYGYVNLTTTSDYPLIIDNCTINGNKANQTGSAPLIALRTFHSSIHDNEIENSVGPAISLTALASDASTCITNYMSDNDIFHNRFDNNVGEGVQGVNCTGGGNPQLADAVITSNFFNGNASSGTTWQIASARSAGFKIDNNKMYTSGGYGNIQALLSDDTDISDNQLDGTTDVANGAAPIEDVVVTTGSSGYGNVSMSGNTHIYTAASLPGSATAYQFINWNNSITGAQQSVTGDSFASTTVTGTIPITYAGTAAASTPLIAAGNSYGTNTIVPTSTQIVLGVSPYFGGAPVSPGWEISPVPAATLTTDQGQASGGSTLLAFAATTGAAVGQQVTGTSIPNGDQVSSIVSTAQVVRAATGTTTSSGALVDFSSTTGFAVGQQCTDTTAPSAIGAGNVILSIQSNVSITMTSNLVGTVTSGDSITCDPVVTLTIASTGTIAAAASIKFIANPQALSSSSAFYDLGDASIFGNLNIGAELTFAGIAQQSSLPVNGIALSSANTIAFYTNSGQRFFVGPGGGFSSTTSTAWSLPDVGASSTQPTFEPNRSDAKSGIGAASAGDVSLICDEASTATECGRFDTSGDFTVKELVSCTTVTTSSAGLFSCTVSSDKYKTLMGPITDASHFIDSLRIETWFYKPQYQAQYGTAQHIGLIAQDVCKGDIRLCVFKGGKIDSYDDRGVMAYSILYEKQLQAQIDWLKLAIGLLALWSLGLTIYVVRRK